MVKPLDRYDPNRTDDITDAQIAEFFPTVWPSGWKQYATGMLAELGWTLNEAKIEWMLISGTMLGAARHGGFIPWDDDIDISIESRWADKLESLVATKLPDWEIQKDHSERDGNYFKLFRNQGELIPGKGKLRWPNIDVFIHRHADSQVSFSTPGFDLPTTDVYPIKLIDFEGLSVPSMNDPYTNYLDPMYPGWREWCVCSDWSHRKEKWLHKTLVRVPVSRLKERFGFLV